MPTIRSFTVLPALPDTATELKAIAREVGAPAADIHLGADASETVVKRTPLADYRIVYFATHGLVAGDIKGLGEPSLALSLPKIPNKFDDGLLTASEVAQLREPSSGGNPDAPTIQVDSTQLERLAAGLAEWLTTDADD